MSRYLLVLSAALLLTATACAAKRPGTSGPSCSAGVGGCLECKKKKCIACDDGLGPDNKGACVPCAPGCSECSTSAKKCKSCNPPAPGAPGVYLHGSGACKPCTAKCAECRDKSGQCTTCMFDFALSGNKCVACTGAGQVVDGNRCKKCPTGCLACATSKRCTADGCDTGFVFNAKNGKCEAEAEAPEAPEDN